MRGDGLRVRLRGHVRSSCDVRPVRRDGPRLVVAVSDAEPCDVRCIGCARVYATDVSTWWRQANRCPTCGEFKARREARTNEDPAEPPPLPPTTDDDE